MKLQEESSSWMHACTQTLIDQSNCIDSEWHEIQKPAWVDLDRWSNWTRYATYKFHTLSVLDQAAHSQRLSLIRHLEIDRKKINRRLTSITWADDWWNEMRLQQEESSSWILYCMHIGAHRSIDLPPCHIHEVRFRSSSVAWSSTGDPSERTTYLQESVYSLIWDFFGILRQLQI